MSVYSGPTVIATRPSADRARTPTSAPLKPPQPKHAEKTCASEGLSQPDELQRRLEDYLQDELADMARQIVADRGGGHEAPPAARGRPGHSAAPAGRPIDADDGRTRRRILRRAGRRPCPAGRRAGDHSAQEMSSPRTPACLAISRRAGGTCAMHEPLPHRTAVQADVAVAHVGSRHRDQEQGRA